jgi:glycosyltransferase involved in cell wall biosynthesis
MSFFERLKRAVRLSKWVLRVFIAAVAGTIFRRARSLAGRMPRILHGMSPFHGTKYMVRADRLAGFPSHSAVWHSRQINYALVRNEDFDVVIERPGVAPDDVHWLCLIHVLLHADIWVAYFESLFFRPDQDTANTWAFRLIRLAGIRIIVQPHGGDVIYRGRYRSRFDWIGLMQKDYSTWDLTANAEVAQPRIRLFCRHAHFVLGGSWFVSWLLPRNDLMFHTVPIDCEELIPAERSPTDRTLIVHSPNHRNVKGTAHLLQAVERLKSEGLDCELQLVERVPRHLAMEIYRKADIIADQFCIGTIGVFALEGMALGKPVMAYIDHNHLGDPVFNHPIVNTNPENLTQVLAVLLQVPALRERLGRAGRASVEKYQSVPPLAEVWDRIYRHVWWGEPLELEKTAHFSPERQARSFTEDPSRADFWPVPVEDLLPDIHAALSRVGFGAAVAVGVRTANGNGVEVRA